MILILFSWIFIFSCSIHFGVLLIKLTKTETRNPVILSFLGLFLITLIATSWAIFGRIHLEFGLFLLGLNVLILLFLFDSVQKIYLHFYTKIKEFSVFVKLHLIFWLVLFLAQCASSPYLIDNESYYIQTIRWLNEYGLVKGVGNLHIFLAQTSGWHITQSVFNFSYLYPNFNDLSGFALLLGAVFSSMKLDDFMKNKNNYSFYGAFLPLAHPLLFLFINTPSPDVPVGILGFIVFFLYLEENNAKNFTLICLLVLFACFIKLSALPLLIFPINIMWEDRILLNPKNPNFKWVFLFTLCTGGLYISKNSILSGYPLYPNGFFSIKAHHVIPKVLLDRFNEATFMSSVELNYHELPENMRFFELFNSWLFYSDFHFLFNSLILVLLVLSPITIYFSENKTKIGVIYFALIMQCLLLIFTFPLFRFMLSFMVFFSIFNLYSLLVYFNFLKFYKLFLFIPVLICLSLLFIKVNVKTEAHKYHKINLFSFDYILYPHKKSNQQTAFKKQKIGNLVYFSPINDFDFYWLTGDVSPPCVNKKLIDYFAHYYHLYPQKIGKSIKDGFYSKKTN